MPERNIQSIIESLKKLKEERGLSVSDILKRIEEDAEKTGCYVSEATLYRVFRKGSESESFDYDHTIKPIVRVLSDMTVDDEFDPECARIYYEQRNALQDVVRYRNDEIAEHRKHMEKTKADHEVQLEQQKASHAAKIEEVKKLYECRCAAHEAHIASLEDGVKYFRMMVDSLLVSQREERESRKILFAEIRRLMDDVVGRLTEDVRRLSRLHEKE